VIQKIIEKQRKTKTQTQTKTVENLQLKKWLNQQDSSFLQYCLSLAITPKTCCIFFSVGKIINKGYTQSSFNKMLNTKTTQLRKRTHH
jgi:hypothetical protein